MTLYQLLKDAGIPLDSHESDLYVKVTRESSQLIHDSGHSASTLRDAVHKRTVTPLVKRLNQALKGKRQ